MDEITCKRCGQKGARMGENPHTGALGELVQNSICPTCWTEWQRFSVKLINEYKLKPFLPEHRAFLEEQMRQFLNLTNPS